MFTTKAFVMETLAIVREPRTVSLTIHERLEDPKRWLQCLTIQTDDPLAE
jgi:hypothetical protein